MDTRYTEGSGENHSFLFNKLTVKGIAMQTEFYIYNNHGGVSQQKEMELNEMPREIEAQKALEFYKPGIDNGLIHVTLEGDKRVFFGIQKVRWPDRDGVGLITIEKGQPRTLYVGTERVIHLHKVA